MDNFIKANKLYSKKHNNKRLKSSEKQSVHIMYRMDFQKIVICWDCPIKEDFFYLDAVTVPEQPDLEVVVQLVHGCVCRGEYRKLAYKIQA